MIIVGNRQLQTPVCNVGNGVDVLLMCCFTADFLQGREMHGAEVGIKVGRQVGRATREEGEEKVMKEAP